MALPVPWTPARAGHHDRSRLSTGDTIRPIVANTLTNRARPVVVNALASLWAWPGR